MANEKYTNPKTGWSNYFLSSPNGGARLELLGHSEVKPSDSPLFRGGPIHLSIALGSRQAVVALTERLRQDGYTVFSEPRQTGDGYFESGVLDPEGNRLELTI